MSTNHSIHSTAGKNNIPDCGSSVIDHHRPQESSRDDDMTLLVKVPSSANHKAAAITNPTTSNPFCMIPKVSNSGSCTTKSTAGSISSTRSNNGCWQRQHRSSSYITPCADVGNSNDVTSTTQTGLTCSFWHNNDNATNSNKKHCGEGALVVSSCCTAMNNHNKTARASKDLNMNDKELREPQSLLQLLQSQNWERAAIRLLTTSEGKEEAQWNIVSGTSERRERGAKKTDNTNSSCSWSILSVIFPPLASEYQMDPPSLLIKALMEYNMDYVAIPRQFNLLISALNVGAHRDIIQTICDVSPQAVTTKNVAGDLPIHFALKKVIKDTNAFGEGGKKRQSPKTKKHQQIMLLLKDSIRILIQTNPKCLMELDSKGDTVLSLAMRASSSSFEHDGHDDGISSSSSNRSADLDFVSLILQYDPEAPNRPNPTTNVWPLEEACLLYSWSSANTLLQKHPSIFMNQPSKFGGRSGKLPFHVAFECRSSKDNKFEFVKHILEYYPHYVTQVDPTERLAPFMLTAIGGTPRHVSAAANTTSSSTTKQTVTKDDDSSKEEEASEISPSTNNNATNNQYNKNASKSNQKSTTTTTTTTTTACLSSTFALLQNSPDMLWYRG